MWSMFTWVASTCSSSQALRKSLSLDTTQTNSLLSLLVPGTDDNVEQTSTFAVYNWVSALPGTLMTITGEKRLEKDSIKVPRSLRMFIRGDWFWDLER